jgi:hypothetical protein
MGMDNRYFIICFYMTHSPYLAMGAAGRMAPWYE